VATLPGHAWIFYRVLKRVRREAKQRKEAKLAAVAEGQKAE